MEKKASTARSTVRSNWGLAFVFNKTLMGGGVLAEGRRQRVARIALNRRDRRDPKGKNLTTDDTDFTNSTVHNLRFSLINVLQANGF